MINDPKLYPQAIVSPVSSIRIARSGDKRKTRKMAKKQTLEAGKVYREHRPKSAASSMCFIVLFIFFMLVYAIGSAT